MKTRFSMIATKTWTDKKFRTLDQHQKLAWLWLITSEARTSEGLFRIDTQLAATNTGTTQEHFIDCALSLEDLGMIKYDQAEGVVFLANSLKNSPTRNPSHAKGCMVRLAEFDRHYLLTDLLEAAQSAGDRLGPLLEEYRDEVGGFDTEPDQPAPTQARSPYKAPQSPPKAVEPYRKASTPVSTQKPLDGLQQAIGEECPLSWFAIQGLLWEAKFSKTDVRSLQRRIEGWAVQTHATPEQVAEWLREQLIHTVMPEKIGNAANYVGAFLSNFRAETTEPEYVSPQQRREEEEANMAKIRAEAAERAAIKKDPKNQPPWRKAGISTEEVARRLANQETLANMIEEGARPKRTLDNKDTEQ